MGSESVEVWAPSLLLVVLGGDSMGWFKHGGGGGGGRGFVPRFIFGEVVMF